MTEGGKERLKETVDEQLWGACVFCGDEEGINYRPGTACRRVTLPCTDVNCRIQHFAHPECAAQFFRTKKDQQTGD